MNHRDLPTGATTGGAPEDTHHPPELEYAGGQLGPYRLLRVIGEGGFGLVWLAERREPHVQRVAIKVIKPGMDSRAVIARFEQERQALALMDHPNVARVFDAGTTPLGRPYVVTEHVDGQPITAYCDRRRLSIRARLELFLPVCEAVQHAHNKGIIHRDLKPTNILVETVEGTGPVPKVIDFGVAKALTPTLAPAAVYTELGQVIGTPAYMSPEQAGERERDIDTRSDVYALGVVLYELLTGQLPFDPDTLASAGREGLRRLIAEGEPPRPSNRVTAAADGGAGAAECRAIPARELAQLLRRELEWIPARAMRKEREQRYATARELADDIRNYLAGRPLRAGPESTAYRLRTFVRRNRGPVAAGVALVAALAAGTAGTAWFAIGEARARREAEAQAGVARATNEFLNTDLLGAAAPSNQPGRGRDVRLRDVLDEASRRLDTAGAPGGRFEGTPLAEAAVHLTIGEAYAGLGEAQRAEDHARRAEAILTAAAGPDHRDTLRARRSLAIARCIAGELEDGARIAAEVLAVSERTLGPTHPDTLATRSTLGLALARLGRLAEAEVQLTAALEGFERSSGADSGDAVHARANLAFLIGLTGRLDEALALERQALAQRRRLYGDGHPETLNSLNNLAGILIDMQREAEAEPYLVEALRGARRVLGVDHPDTITIQGNLAAVNRILGRLEESETLARDTLERCERVLGPAHADTALAQRALAIVLARRGDAPAAAALAARALESIRAAMGESHPAVVHTLVTLGQATIRDGRAAEGFATLADAVARARTLPEPDPTDLAMSVSALGTALAEAARFSEAEPLLLEAERLAGPNLRCGLESVPLRRVLADLYHAWNAAEPTAERAAAADHWRAEPGDAP